MYQSIEVQELLTPTEEDKVFLKEERIGEIIKSFTKAESSSIKKIFFLFLGGFSLPFIAYHSTKMISDYFNLNVQDATVGLITSPFAVGAVLLFLGLIIQIEHFQKSKDKVKELFTELSDKPYQIRLESTGLLSNTYKVIVEENLVIENGHVIKDKSKHITGYVDLSKNRHSIVSFVHELVKKSEELFTKK